MQRQKLYCKFCMRELSRVRLKTGKQWKAKKNLHTTETSLKSVFSSFKMLIFLNVSLLVSGKNIYCRIARRHKICPRSCLLQTAGGKSMDEIRPVGLLGLSKRFADGFRLFSRFMFPHYFKYFSTNVIRQAKTVFCETSLKIESLNSFRFLFQIPSDAVAVLNSVFLVLPLKIR